MANILLVDSDEIAQKAMNGILARGNHRFVAVDNAAEAWSFILSNVKIDLLIVELKLQGDGGLTLIQRLKNDCFLEKLPVIVYTAHGTRSSIMEALRLHAQNVLLKPYKDDLLFAEVAKSTSKPWIQQHFEDEETVCQAKNIEPERLRKMLRALQPPLEKLPKYVERLREQKAEETLFKSLAKLSAHAAATGASTIGKCLSDLRELGQEANWPEFEKQLEQLSFATPLISYYLEPTKRPEGFLSAEELNSEAEGQARALWSDAPAEERCPVIGWDQLQREIDALDGCPIIDTIAAAYQMAANGHPTSLSPLLDLVQKDPSLMAQILIASAKLKKGDDSSAIEDPRVAVNLLGENRLASMGGSLLTVEERMLSTPPHGNWPSFLMFQLGTAQLAQFVCKYLEMPDLENAAYTAGLIHDLGKILLIHLHPFAFQAIHDHAEKYGMKLSAAEKVFLETTTLEMAVHFSEKQGLPQRFVNVFRWIDKPQGTNEDASLVAIVSLARYFCRRNDVGFSGETRDDTVSLEDSPQWKVLSSRLYLNFDLEKFERQVHHECLRLKRELRG